MEMEGLLEGQNFIVEYRWASGQYSKLPSLAAELVEHKVAVIATSGGIPAARAAKNATSTIPIVFLNGSDPVRSGLVTSLNRPQGNVTGVSLYNVALLGKRLGLIRDLLPNVSSVGVLINPNFAETENQIFDLNQASTLTGIPVQFVEAPGESGFDGAYEKFSASRVTAVLIGADPFFDSHREHLVSLAARYSLPTIYDNKEYTKAGGLMSYGTNFVDAYRQLGVYTARILKGTPPAELPVLLPSTFELVINLKTAKALGLTVPPTLLARADEVIE